MKEFIGLAE
jgi:hypothetical protein